MKFIVFIDALNEIDLSGWIEDNYKLTYNPGVSKVTPNVFSQILTGKNAEDMRFVRTTPYKKPREIDLKDKTRLNKLGYA